MGLFYYISSPPPQPQCLVCTGFSKLQTLYWDGYWLQDLVSTSPVGAFTFPLVENRLVSHEGWSLKSLVICVWHWNLSDPDGKGHADPGEYYVSWLLQVCTSCWLIVDATSMLIPKFIIYLVLWMCYLPYNRKKRCVWSLRLENESLTIVESDGKENCKCLEPLWKEEGWGFLIPCHSQA